MRWDIRMWLEHEERSFTLYNVSNICFDEDGCTVTVGDGEVRFDRVTNEGAPIEAFVVECVHDPHTPEEVAEREL